MQGLLRSGRPDRTRSLLLLLSCSHSSLNLRLEVALSLSAVQFLTRGPFDSSSSAALHTFTVKSRGFHSGP